MFKVTNEEGRSVSATTPEDVFREVRNITGNIFCAGKARNWAASKNRFPKDKFSLFDYWDMQIAESRSGVTLLDNAPYFKVVALW